MIPQRPEGPQDPEQVGQRPGVVGQVPAHGCGQVTVLGLQPVKPLVLAEAAQRPVSPLGQRPVVAGVTVLDLGDVRPAASRSATNSRTVSSIRARGAWPVLSSWIRLCRASASITSSARFSSRSATWAAASMVQPLINTAMVSSSDRSVSSSRFTLQSTVARRVR